MSEIIKIKINRFQGLDSYITDRPLRIIPEEIIGKKKKQFSIFQNGLFYGVVYAGLVYELFVDEHDGDQIWGIDTDSDYYDKEVENRIGNDHNKLSRYHQHLRAISRCYLFPIRRTRYYH